MNSKQIYKKISSWAKSEKNPALQLMEAGISPRAAERMIKGTYKHRLRQSTINKLKQVVSFFD